MFRQLKLGQGVEISLMQKSRGRVTRKDFYNRSRSDNDRVHDLFRSAGLLGYREVELISVWSHPFGKWGRRREGWISGRWVTAVLRLNYRHPIEHPSPTQILIYPSLFDLIAQAIFHLSFRSLVCHRSSFHNKRRRFSIARAIWVTQLYWNRPGLDR